MAEKKGNIEKIKIGGFREVYLKHLNDQDVSNNKRTRKGLNDLISKLTQNNIESIDKNVFGNYLKLRCLYNFYLEELIIKLEAEGRTIEKILVFESPPESGQHFLTHGGNYYSCFGENEQEFDIEVEKRFNKYYTDLRKQGRTHPLQIVKNEQQQFITRLSTVLSSNIVYIDLFLLPVDFKKPREKWKSAPYFKDVDGKRLTVWIFEWAMENLKKELIKGKINPPFNINCKIAFGTPINTSISIFEYYRNKWFNLDNDIKIDLTIPNSPNSFLKQDLEGTIFPMFKFNVVNSSNQPCRKLVKNAFNL